jgi:hypothetical protein
MGGAWPVRCAPVGLVAVGSILWRFRGQLRCTVVVKATFSLPETGPMTRINPQALRRSDDYMSGVPSLAGAAEMAPRMPQAGAVIVGSAYSKEPTRKRAVRFTVVRGNTLLIDKTLYVYGDRVKGGAPKKFTKMHLGYERALGGIEFSRNPIGVGLEKDGRRPNVLHPHEPKRYVAGYGPVPARFPRRRRKLGKVRIEEVENGIADYPDEFDWSYFQAAPRDQRVEALRGDEWLLLEGMHPTHARQRIRLPKGRGLARIYQLKDVGAPDSLDLVCDTLHIEPDRERCSLVWRGEFPLGSVDAAASLVLVGAVHEFGEAITWPRSIDELDGIASPGGKGGARGQGEDQWISTAVSPGAGPRGEPLPPNRAPRPMPPLPQRPARVPPPAAPEVPPPIPQAPLPRWDRYHEAPPPTPGPLPAPPSSAGYSQGAASWPYPPSAAASSAVVPQRTSQAHSPPAAMTPGTPRTPGGIPGGTPGKPVPPRPRQRIQPPPHTVVSPTGTIPAPPPEDPADLLALLERTDEIESEADEPANPLERTDPLAEVAEEPDWSSTVAVDDMPDDPEWD